MRNSKFILSAACAISAIVGIGAASAADLPARTYTKAPAIVASYNWSGFYAGVNAGALWQNSDQTTVVDPGPTLGNPVNTAAIGAVGTGSDNRTKFTGGGQIGYNWQAIGSAWVWGLEADFSGVAQNGSRSGSAVFPANAPSVFTVTSSSGYDWFATFRGRVGYAFDRSMIYATGGLAVADLRVSQSYLDNLPPSGSGAGATSVTKAGWTLGAGWAYAVASSWTIKAEYLYMHFDNVGVNYLIAAPGFGPDTAHFNSSFDANHILRVGLNYKFGGGPVVAKY
jgi:outer membrane immunogenic protein